jgi:hypothetical protein
MCISPHRNSPCTAILLSLPKSSPTRYRKPGTSSSDFFSVEAVYLAWLLRDAHGEEYMKQARENGLAVAFVSVTERKSVVDWLEGKIADSERIMPLSGGWVHDQVLERFVVLMFVTIICTAETSTPPGTPP